MQLYDVWMRELLQVFDFPYGIHRQAVSVLGINLDLLNSEDLTRVVGKVGAVDVGVGTFTELIIFDMSVFA